MNKMYTMYKHSFIKYSTVHDLGFKGTFHGSCFWLSVCVCLDVHGGMFFISLLKKQISYFNKLIYFH
jgi:hypothetical protein